VKNGTVFVHIPKTAGTSFRNGLEDALGKKKVCYDYGQHSDVTSKIVQQYIYKTPDKWQFYEQFSTAKYSVISGHFNALKYAHLFGVHSIATFIRNPIDRVISEYKHLVRHYDLDKPFDEFALTESQTNKQVNIMQGIPWPALGFIGVTEHYNDSISLFRQCYGTKLKEIKSNVGQGSPIEKISDEVFFRVERANQRDFDFYSSVKDFFFARLQAFNNNTPFTRGMLSPIQDKKISGWAFTETKKSISTAVLDIAVNGTMVGNTKAKEYRGGLNQLGFYRKGFIGFNFDVPSLRNGDQVRVSCAETGQLLVNGERTFCEAN